MVLDLCDEGLILWRSEFYNELRSQSSLVSIPIQANTVDTLPNLNPPIRIVVSLAMDSPGQQPDNRAMDSPVNSSWSTIWTARLWSARSTIWTAWLWAAGSL